MDEGIDTHGHHVMVDLNGNGPSFHNTFMLRWVLLET
jgi:hypothetical protein